ncbi:2Fe-2S iron-sulfur cluster-binding protein [Spirillospora sp. NPDC047279]|uniref:2Fe-2S iron-sulfur cluster-binding protein n=1 Tax=Spirillospora sp. NPDC047279 TaxID=3155478 RepID=UPI0034043EEF
MTGSLRTARGGSRIDRSRRVTFTFDGVPYEAHPGDTLASALLAHGVRVVARGPYSGRPRGVYSCGAEEPNAFVQVESGPGEPMVRATRLEVHEGLRAVPLAGRGRLAGRPDTSRYDRTYAHCDVLVVGGGRSGVAAARAAAEAGARVILADDQPRPAAEIGPFRELTVLRRTTVTGYYDHDLLTAVERRTDHLAGAPAHMARQRLWHIRAGRTVLATGALERPVLFPGNDRPGIMLAHAAAAYIERYGVLPGRRAVVFSTHEEPELPGVEIVRRIRAGETVTGTEAGDDGVLTAVLVGGERVPCDLLAVSGGWNPNLHLYGQAGGRTRWSAEHGGFVPDGGARGDLSVVGRARGVPGAFTEPPPPQDSARIYVDFQRDATLADVWRATGAGLTSGEHVKRFTTIGTAADQGRTSAVITARLLGEESVTTQRPPVEPITFALLAGRDRGALLAPVRRTPMHTWHEEHGALFENVGDWKRPWYYPRPGESMEDAVLRECRAAREDAAALDASTLGKIDVQGPDAGEFLDRFYTGRFSTLRTGRCRYGVMCGTDGMIFDDGVVARLGSDHFHLTTTTGNAGAVLDRIEEWLQTEWPGLRVRCTSVTDQWATVALVGPRSRDLLGTLADLPARFPFMGVHTGRVAGLPARVFRISYSGEPAYEINVPSWHGLTLWEAVVNAGATPYGTETMHVLRAEKGYIVVGQETDGTVTPADAGLSWTLAADGDWIGRRSLRRPDTARPGRKRLVGLRPLDDVVLTEGAQLVDAPGATAMRGHVTSAYRGTVGSFALGLLAGGATRTGERVYAVTADRTVPVEVTDPVFYDKEGSRRDG